MRGSSSRSATRRLTASRTSMTPAHALDILLEFDCAGPVHLTSAVSAARTEFIRCHRKSGSAPEDSPVTIRSFSRAARMTRAVHEGECATLARIPRHSLHPSARSADPQFAPRASRCATEPKASLAQSIQLASGSYRLPSGTRTAPRSGKFETDVMGQVCRSIPSARRHSRSARPERTQASGPGRGWLKCFAGDGRDNASIRRRRPRLRRPLRAVDQRRSNRGNDLPDRHPIRGPTAQTG